MLFKINWRIGMVLGALALTTALIVVPSSRQIVAQADGVPAEFRNIPADAMVFAHVDVEALLKLKIGDAIQAAMVEDLKKMIIEAEENTGITPGMVKSMTVFIPALKQPSKAESFYLKVVLLKPYDKTKFVAAIKKAHPMAVEADGIVSFKPDAKSVKDLATGKVSDPPKPVVVDLKQATQFTIYYSLDEKYQANPPATDGPLTAVLKSSRGNVFTVAINIGQLPAEVRGDAIPAELKPIQPLMLCDSMVTTGQLNGDALTVSVRFHSKDKVKVVEAEKSLTVGVSLLQVVLSAGIQQLDKSNDASQKEYVPLMKSLTEIVRNAKVIKNENDGYADVTFKSDATFTIPFAKFLAVAPGKMRSAAAQSRTQNNLKQLGLGMHNFLDATGGGFPAAAICDKDGKPLLSWRVAVLPYIEQDKLYKQFKLDEPWDSDHNKKVLENNPMPPQYLLEGVSKPGENTTYFRVFAGNGALFEMTKPTKIRDVTDGTSNTILIATAATAVAWTKPEALDFDPKGDMKKLMMLDNEGCNVALADGSVRFLMSTIKAETLKALITKGGGEVINLDD